MRKKIIIGNWKMNKDRKETIDYLMTLNKMLYKNYLLSDEIQLAIAPSYLCLIAALLYISRGGMFTKNMLKKLIIMAQNCNEQESGSYTGDVSWWQLKQEGINWCIIGHFEHRLYDHEDDEQINKKLVALLNNDMHAVLCIGETKEAKENETGNEYLMQQLAISFQGVVIDKLENVVIAYEPVYAIGSMQPLAATEVEIIIRQIRAKIASLYSQEAAGTVRIIYGGSVNCANYNDYIKSDVIDGLLIGKTSLDVTSFYDIAYGTSLTWATKYPALGNKYYILKQKEINVLTQPIEEDKKEQK